MGSPYHRFNSLKILAYADRLRAIVQGKMPYPIDWHIYPTNACNHSCAWCMFRQNGEQAEHPAELPRDLFMRAVGDAARTGARLIHLSGGGEPLLNRHTLEAILMAERLGLAVALSTNGSLLTPGIAAHVDFVRVSLNAGTEEQHTRTNHSAGGAPDWERIVANIAACVPHRKRDLGLSFVADHDNYRDIYPFCALAADAGVDFVHIRPAFWYDSESDRRTRGAMAPALEECERARADFGDKLAIHAITEKFDGHWSPRRYDACLAALTGTCLTATGDFAVCQDRTDLRFGAAYKEGASFEEVWLFQGHQRVVASLISPGALDRCPRCVWNKRNEIIQEVFIRDEMRLDLP